MNIGEFRKIGYLQELNRQFLHPLGLALEINVGEDGEESLVDIWDYRSDPEGILYDEKFPIDPEAFRKARMIKVIGRRRAARRERILGFVVQPIKGLED
jgi:hypothetical protein